MTERAYAPHCDQRVLHKPGECEYCDGYPDWQELREKWGIAYTGHEPAADTVTGWRELPCPADANRPPGSPSDHRRWGGNVAAPPGIVREHYGDSGTVHPTPPPPGTFQWHPPVQLEVGDTARCSRPPRGWYCTRDAGHEGPCPTWPRWWNIPGRWRGR